MKNLTVFSVDAIDHLVQPDEFDDLTPQSPALAILTDFRSHRAHVVEAHIPAAEAVDLMLQENVNIKLVVDGKGEFTGLVSYEDLSDQAIMLIQNSHHVRRNEVLVSDLMHARESIRAINYEDFERASVADIIFTLQRHGQRYYRICRSAKACEDSVLFRVCAATFPFAQAMRKNSASLVIKGHP